MIYVLQDGDRSFRRRVTVKIGYSGSPDGVGSRLRGLQCGNPRELRLLAMLPGDRGDESTIHATLRDLRLGGEWFEIPRGWLPEAHDTAERWLRRLQGHRGARVLVWCRCGFWGRRRPDGATARPCPRCGATVELLDTEEAA